MNFMTTAPLGLMMTVALSSSHAFGLVAKSKSNAAKMIGKAALMSDVLRPTFTKPALTKAGNATVRIQHDQRSGAIRLMSGAIGLNLTSFTSRFDQAARDKFAEAAQQWLVNQEQLVGKPGLVRLQLDTRAVVFDKRDQLLKFRVYRDDLLVTDAVVDMRFKHGVLVQVLNMSFAEAKSNAAVLAATKINTMARVSGLGFSRVTFQGTALRVHPAHKSYELLAVDRYAAMQADEPVLVEMGKDGRLVAVTATNHYLAGQVAGDVYRRYYKDDINKVGFANIEVALAADSTIHADAAGVFDVAADVSPFVEGLRSAVVDVQASTGALTRRNSTSDANGHTVYFNRLDTAQSHDDKELAQNMIFYHTQVMVDYAKKFITTDWFNHQLVANANLSSSCNAHWDGSTINFYSADETCANTGLIADVVYHEWGHGLDENTGGIEDSAYSEGFGDIMSLIMTRSNVLGIGFGLNGRIVRDLEPDLVYPRDRGEVHFEGMIIGGTFFDLYQLLAAKHGDNQAIGLLSNFAFKGIVAASRYTDLYQALLVIDDNDSNLDNGSPNFCSLNEAFARHGLAEVSSRCQMGRIDQLGAVEVEGNGNGIIEPGETIALNPVLLNNTMIDLQNISAQVTLESANTGITIDRAALTWDNIAQNAAGASRESLTLKVADDVACGTPANLKFAAKSSEREAVINLPFIVGLLSGIADRFTLPNLPVNIPDEDSVTLPFDVQGDQWADGATILNAHLLVKIAHTYAGDLKVNLLSPSGETFEVARGSGSSADLNIDADISSLIKGHVAAGSWSLVVSDDAARDTGSVKEATLTLTPANFVCRP